MFAGSFPYHYNSVGLSSGTLTIGAGVTIRGVGGYIGYSPVIGGSPANINVINQGTILADTSDSTLILDPGTWSSSGILRVDNGGTLALQGTGDNNGGTITLDGSDGTFSLTGSIASSTISETNGATLQGQGGTLDAVILNGSLSVSGNNSVVVKNGLTLNGTATLGSGNNYGFLNFSGSQTLGGTGTVVFAGSFPYHYNSVGLSSGTLTIGAGVTIRGVGGYIGYSPVIGGSPANINVINQGTILADTSDSTLILDPGTWSSSGILRVDNGGTLALQGTGDNNGGTITLDGSDGTFSLTGSIASSTISETNGATLQGQGGTLDAVILNGSLSVSGYNSVVVKNGLTLNGTATLGSGNNYGFLNFSGSQTLGGTGTVVFAGSFPYHYNSVGLSSGTLTIGAGVTIRGVGGYIGYSPVIGGSPANINVINQGTILADTSDSTLILDPGTWSSSGILRVDNGGTLALQGTGDNNGGTITLDGSDGTFSLTGSIASSTISETNGATLQGQGGTLDAVILNGSLSVSGNNSVVVKNGLTLNGTATLGGGGNNNYGFLNFSGSQTLGGSGSVVFTGSGPYNSVGLSAGTLTIGSGITIRGQSGYVGYSPVIGGNPANISVVNQGTLQWTAGTSISAQATLTNNGTITIDSSGVMNTGGTIKGGTITTQAGAQITGGILDGVTINGDFLVAGTNAVTIANGLTLNGTATLGGGGNNNYGFLNFSGSQTLGGSGSVVFTGSGPYNSVGLSSGTLTIGSGITIHGQSGYVGYSPVIGGNPANIALVNQGLIQADANGSTIALTATAAAFLNSGTVSASVGSITLSSSSQGTNNSGTVTVGPTGLLSISGPYIQTPSGNFNVVLGGSTSSLYGHAAISGTASLAGTLNVSEANSFTPSTGNLFTFLSFTSATGQFANYTGLSLPNTTALQPGYNTGTVTLTTVTSTTIAPDLRVTNLAINPASPESSQHVTINWTDLNAGNGSTGSSWTDYLVVTNTTTGQTLATADVPYDATINGNLASNGSSARSYSFRMPDGTAGVGNLQVSVTTDYNNTIAEYYPGNVGESNNSTTMTVASTLASYPDLQVSGLGFTPTSPSSGKSLAVQWSDTNNGLGATSGNWTDQVTVVNSTTGQTLVTANVPYNAGASGNIAANGSSPQLSYTFALPDGLAGTGGLRITVTTNVNGDLYEYNSGGTATTNNTATVTETSSLSSYADLIVANIAVQTPASPQSGNQVTVGWDDKNIGSATVSGAFNDYVLVQRVNPDNSLTNIAAGTLSGNATLAANSTSHQTFTFTLPDGATGAGNFLVTVTTNNGQTVKEYDNLGNTACGNNASSANFTATVANYADLKPVNIAVQSPASPQSGNQVTIGWDDKNVGTEAVSGAFNDFVTVQRVNADNSLTTIASGNLNGNATLAAGATSHQTFAFTLADGAAGAWNFLVTVTTDNGQTVTEYDNLGNTAFGNNTSSVNFTATLANYADLKPVNITVESPASPQSGNPVTIGWDDKNLGTGAVCSGFNDYVLVQRVNPDSSLTTIASGNLNGDSTLAAGSTSHQTFTFTLADGAAGAGNFLVTVTTDNGQTVKEYDNLGYTAFGNNSSTATFTTSLANYADLTPLNIAVQTPVSPQSGNQVTIGWDDKNVGTGAVNSVFNDSILVQRINSDDSLTTIASGNLNGNATLDAGATSHQTFAFTLADGAAGAGNILVTVTTDNGQTVKEYDRLGNTAFGNNISSADFTATVANYADLQPVNIAVESPATPKSGNQVTIGWDDKNIGSGAVSSDYNDTVLVQRVNADNSLTTVSSGNVAGNSTLIANATIHQTYRFLLADGAAGAGNFRVTVTTNIGQTVQEYDNFGSMAFGNNTSTLNFTSTIANYSDLAVSGVTVPVTVVPGQKINVGWTLANLGAASANGSWTEQVLLAENAAGDNPTLLAVQTNSGPLAAGQSVPRSLSAQIPSQIAGKFWLVVRENPFGQFVELDTSNNMAVAQQPMNIAVALSLAPAANTIAQNANPNSLAVTLHRTGDTFADMTVSLSSDNSADLSVPNTVTIPAGQSIVTFNATVHDSGIAVANQIVHLTASLAGAVSGSATVTVLDTDQPALLVTAPVSLTEGQSASFTVMRGGDISGPLTVHLSVSLPSQITVPATVVIPAGQPSVTATMTSIDYGLPEKPQNVTVNATAIGEAPGSATTVFFSNNIPTLSLTPGSESVLESQTATGIRFVVSRQKVTGGPLTVKLYLSDATLGTIPATVVIPANAASTSCTFLPINDHLADGPHTEVITAYGAYASCGCTILSGSSSTAITIVNDNQPSLALGLSKTLIFKDDTNPAALGTVSRFGSDTSSPLLVSLASSDTTEASVPDSVTIPAGQLSAAFPIAAVANGSKHGNQTVTVSANANGFAAGSSSLTVTDIELPQLVVTHIESSSSTVATDNQFFVSFTITNQGRAPATGTWQQQLYISDNAQGTNATLVGAYSITATLNPNESFSRTVPVTAPDAPGNYYMVVADDVGNQITQVSGGNNLAVSPQPVQVTAEYTAKVNTDVTVAPAGTSVTFTGNATIVSSGAPAQYKLVDVHVDVRGIDRVVSALTDSSGNFSVTFTPLPNEAGVYTFFAAHPHVATGRLQGVFSLVGLTADPSQPSLTLIPGAAAVSGQITLKNLGDVALTQVTAAVLTAPTNFTVSLSLGDGSNGQVLAGDGSLTLNYTLSALAGTAAGHTTITLHVLSNEGATLDIPIDVTVKALLPSLVTDPGSLYSGMVLGSQTLVSFRVSNDGGAATGPLAVLLPQNAPWLQLSSPGILPSLQPSDAQTITLQLTPDESLALANYSGKIEVKGTGAGADISVPFTFKAISNAVGSLSVDAQDEYTFFASGAPHVIGAHVTISDALSGAVVSSGVTGNDGSLLISSLPAGYYTVSVTDAGHDSYTATAIIGAGALTSVTAFMPLQTVTESWTVTPTQIQDQTQVSLNVTFSTNVPVPVVLVTPGSIDLSSLTAVGQTLTVQLKVTNHGLIAAQNVTFSFPSHPFYRFNPLVSHIDSLAAESSLTIPMVITKVGGVEVGPGNPGDDGGPGVGGGGGGGTGGTPDCAELSAGTVRYEYVCGPDHILRRVPIYFQHAVDPCATPPIPIGPPPIISVTGPQPIARPGGPSNNNGGPGGGGGPGTGGGSTPRGISGPGTVTVTDPPPPVKSQPCTPEPCPQPASCMTYMLGYSGGILSELNRAMENLPGTPEVKIKGSETICDNGEVSAAGGIEGELKADLPLVGKSIHKTISALGYEATLDLELDLAELVGSFSIGGGGEWKRNCDGVDHWSISLEAGGEIGIQAKAQIGGELKTPSGGDYKDNFTITAGVYADLKYKYASEDGKPATSSGELRIRLSAQGEIKLGDFTLSVTFDDIIYDMKFGEESSTSAATAALGLSTTSLSPTQQSAAATSTHTSAATADPPDIIGIQFGGQFGGSTHAITLTNDDIWEGVPIEGEARMLGYASPALMSQDLGIPLPDGPLTEATAQAILLRYDAIHGHSGNVCAKVVLQIDQHIVLTRDAFIGSLQLGDQKPTPLENVHVQLHVYDTGGNDRTSLFSIQSPTLSGLSAVDGTGTIAGNSTGSASWTIVPSDLSAPSQSTNYTVGGVIQYVDNGVTVTITLTPAPITVKPQPALNVNYFLQRDVYSEDPTRPGTEPSVPFVLGVIVTNTGGGTATNLLIDSAQPQIVDNEKGLLNDFQIIATQVNGNPLTPSLVAKFGDLGPGQTGAAEWLMTSTLQGQFTHYEATFTDTSGLNQPNVSIVKSVTIHSLVHAVDAYGSYEDKKPDFLVDDNPQTRDQPDTLYLSDGTTAPVGNFSSPTFSGSPNPSHLTVQLTMSTTTGWNYLDAPDPGNGLYTLLKVVRSDGIVLPAADFWQTDRNFVGIGKEPIYENDLHLFDNNSTGSYMLYYAPTDHTPPVSAVAALPLFSHGAFTVSWSGSDNDGGSGLENYSIFVSNNSGPFIPWLMNATQTSATYSGIEGYTYEFYSVATDNAGNVQSLPTGAQPVTTVDIVTLSAGFDQLVKEGETVGLGSASYRSVQPTSQLTMTVNWGDDAAESGTLVQGTGGGTIANTHQYANAGNYTVTLSLSDATGFSAVSTLLVAVADVPLTITKLTPPSPVEGISTGSVTVATFIDANPIADINDFTAAVSWGDGQTSIATAANGGIKANLDGTFSVVASHTYSQAAHGLNFSVTISDIGGCTKSLSTTVDVAKTTSTAVVSSKPDSSYGQVVTLTATVTASGVTPTGQVQFQLDNANYGLPVTLTNGVATINLPAGLAVGSHTASAIYMGGTELAGSTSASITQTVARATATIVVNGYTVAFDGQSHTATGTATGVDGSSLSGLTLSGTTHSAAGVYDGDTWSFHDPEGHYSDANGTVNDTIGSAPVITTQPVNTTVNSGATASFTATASGSPTPTVQWQVSTNGTTWTNLSGATSGTYSFATTPADTGKQYRAIFTNAVGSVTTNAVILTVQTVPVVTTQPLSTTVTAGSTATFSAAASGSPTPTVQWQVSLDNGASWNNVTGATTTTYSFTTIASQNNWQFRAVFTNVTGTATTNAANLSVGTAPVVLTQPSNIAVVSGATASFTAKAGGTPTPSVQWQVSVNNGSTWNNISGATSSTYSFAAATTDNGKQYRAVFTNSVGSATTTPAVLSVAPVSVSANVIGVGVKWGTSGSAALFEASGGTLLPSGRTVDIPWANINQISIILNQSVSSLIPSDVSVSGLVGGNYGPVTVTGSGTSWTITLAKVIANADKVTVTIGNSQLTSYQRILNILPGDINDDGVVTSADVTLVNSAISAPYILFADFNGDGLIDSNDLKYVRGKVGTRKIT